MFAIYLEMVNSTFYVYIGSNCENYDSINAYIKV